MSIDAPLTLDCSRAELAARCRELEARLAARHRPASPVIAARDAVILRYRRQGLAYKEIVPLVNEQFPRHRVSSIGARKAVSLLMKRRPVLS